MAHGLVLQSILGTSTKNNEGARRGIVCRLYRFRFWYW